MKRYVQLTVQIDDGCTLTDNEIQVYLNLAIVEHRDCKDEGIVFRSSCGPILTKRPWLPANEHAIHDFIPNPVNHAGNSFV